MTGKADYTDEEWTRLRVPRSSQDWRSHWQIQADQSRCPTRRSRP